MISHLHQFSYLDLLCMLFMALKYKTLSCDSMSQFMQSASKQHLAPGNFYVNVCWIYCIVNLPHFAERKWSLRSEEPHTWLDGILSFCYITQGSVWLWQLTDPFFSLLLLNEHSTYQCFYPRQINRNLMQGTFLALPNKIKY